MLLISAEDLNSIHLYIVKKYYIKDVGRHFEKLDKWKQEELAEYQYCWDHFPQEGDVVDGVPMQKFRCGLCIKNKDEAKLIIQY